MGFAVAKMDINMILVAKDVLVLLAIMEMPILAIATAQMAILPETAHKLLHLLFLVELDAKYVIQKLDYAKSVNFNI